MEKETETEKRQRKKDRERQTDNLYDSPSQTDQLCQYSKETKRDVERDRDREKTEKHGQRESPAVSYLSETISRHQKQFPEVARKLMEIIGKNFLKTK